MYSITIYKNSACWIWVVDYQISVKCFIIVCDKTQGRLAIGLFNWYIHPKRSKLNYFICVDESVLFCKNTFCACTFFFKVWFAISNKYLKIMKKNDNLKWKFSFISIMRLMTITNDFFSNLVFRKSIFV